MFACCYRIGAESHVHTLQNVAHLVQLTALDKSTFTDMARDKQPLSAIGIHHGDMVSTDLTGPHLNFRKKVQHVCDDGNLVTTYPT